MSIEGLIIGLIILLIALAWIAAPFRRTTRRVGDDC